VYQRRIGRVKGKKGWKSGSGWYIVWPVPEFLANEVDSCPFGFAQGRLFAGMTR
jgi:hypothetical protein